MKCSEESPAVSKFRFVAPRLSFLALLFFPASIFLAHASGFLEPILLGTDPSKDSPASIDILEIYLTNNGTHFQFIVKCRSVPEPSPATSYHVYLDTKEGGATDGTYIGADYYLEAKDDSYLYEWRDNTWKRKSRIEFQIDHDDKTIALTAELVDIGYPGNVKETIGVVVATFQPSNNLRDRAPDTGYFPIAHEVIPELPWPTPLVFIPAVIATITILCLRRLKKS